MFADVGKIRTIGANADSDDPSRRPPGTATRTGPTGTTLVVDHLAEQGWGRLADGTTVWEDDHRATPPGSRSSEHGVAAS